MCPVIQQDRAAPLVRARTPADSSALPPPSAPAPPSAIAGQPGNSQLARVLDELGWTLARLVAELNGVLGAGFVSRSAATEWVRRGRVPREPLPTVITHILSGALDRDIPLAELWGYRVNSSPQWLSAYEGIAASWDVVGTFVVIREWLNYPEGTMDLDRRTFLALSGAALTGPVWDYVEHAGAHPPRTVADWRLSQDPHRKITPAAAEVIAATIDHIRRLDDKEGGTATNLNFVHRHFLTVGEYLRDGQATNETVVQSLLSSYAQLGQIAGWMAFDAEKHGLAQRYYRTALQAAHSAGDRALGAHILGFMTDQAVYRGQLREAMELATAARETAEGTPAAVRSLMAARAALAQASAGNSYGLQAEMDRSRALMNNLGAQGATPSYLYWWNPQDEEAFVTLRMEKTRSKDHATLLSRAESTLAGFITRENAARQRDSLYYSALLSRAALANNKVERAIEVGDTVVDGFASLRHPRSLTQLRRLRTELGERRDIRRKPEVVGFRAKLDAVLTARTSGSSSDALAGRV